MVEITFTIKVSLNVINEVNEMMALLVRIVLDGIKEIFFCGSFFFIKCIWENGRWC